MTFTQIGYFLEVARCLNITEAAAHLHMTQPTLSRQIAAIESELNMQLFIRGQKALKLTPGGAVLKDELERLMEDYDQILQKAERASWGMTGVLRIGVLEGHDVSEILPDAIAYLERRYPNVKLYIQRYTYSKLVEYLYTKKLDLIIDYDFHLKEQSDISTMPVQQVRPVLALPKQHPLAQKEEFALSDLQGEPFVIVNEAECPGGVELIKYTCREYGGFYPNFHFVDTMEDATLWVEAGVRCALFNTGMSIMSNKNIRKVDFPQLPPMNVVLGWYEKNENEALPLLIDYFKAKQKA